MKRISIPRWKNNSGVFYTFVCGGYCFTLENSFSFAFFAKGRR